MADSYKLKTPKLRVVSEKSIHTQLYIEWDDIPDAADFRLKLNNDPEIMVQTDHYKFTGLTPGKPYTITLRATALGWTDSDEGTITFTPQVHKRKCSPPSLKVNPVSTGPDRVSAMWDKVNGAVRYRVRLDPPVQPAIEVKALNHTFAGLTPGTDYRYFVTAIGDGIMWDNSDEVELVIPTTTTTNTPKAQKLAGAVIADAPFTKVNETSIELSWGNVPNAQKFEVTISPDNTVGKSVFETTDAPVTLDNLSPNKAYTISVISKADPADANFVDSDPVTKTLTTKTSKVKLAGVVIKGSPHTKPDRTDIRVEWDAVKNAHEYLVKISPADNNGKSEFITINSPIDILNLTPDKPYNFTIITKADPASNFIDSDPVTKTLRTLPLVKLNTPVPKSVKAKTTMNSLGVDWKAIPNADGYLYRADGGSWLPTTTTSVDIPNLNPDTEYTFEVKATTTNPKKYTESDIGSVKVRTDLIPDTTKPIITVTGGDEGIHVSGTYMDKGATALDDRDGDITGKVVTTGSVDTTKPGIYTIHYNVSDTAGNPADEKTRTVTVKASANIIVTGTDESIAYGSVYNDKGAVGTDDMGKPINVQTSGTIDTTKPGVQKITYTIPAGPTVAKETTAERTVTVLPQSGKATFVVDGNAVITIEEGDTFKIPTVTSVTKDDGTAGNIADVVVTGTVDANKAGSYVITYTYPAAKSGGSKDIIIKRKVIVKKAHKVFVPADLTPWLEGDVLYYDVVKGSEYDKAVDLARITETPIDLHPENKVAVFYDSTALDPYERRIIADLSNKDY